MTSPVSETRRFSQQQVVAASRFTRWRQAVTARTGITATGGVVLAIAVIAWLVGRLFGGMPLFMTAYGLLGVFAVCFGLGRRQLPLTGERVASRPRLAEGETISID